MTGGYMGVFAAGGADSDGLSADSNEIYGNFAAGISLDFSNDDAVLSNNRIHDQIVYFAPGIFGRRSSCPNHVQYRPQHFRSARPLSRGTAIMATGNDISGANVGIQVGVGGGPENLIIVQDNTVHDNSRVGIQASDNVLIKENRVFGQQLDNSATGISVFGSAQIVGNTVYGNRYGIVTISRASANRVYHNSVIGIEVGLSGIADGNYVYSNPIGIQAGIGGYGNSTQVLNNLVYANTNQGILVGRTYAANNVKLVNNTVYQPVGDAILLDGDTSDLVLRNNLLWIDAGYAVHATTDNQANSAAITTCSSRASVLMLTSDSGWAPDQHTLANWQRDDRGRSFSGCRRRLC